MLICTYLLWAVGKHGLDSGLDSGLDFGLDFGLEFFFTIDFFLVSLFVCENRFLWTMLCGWLHVGHIPVISHYQVDRIKIETRLKQNRTTGLSREKNFNPFTAT